MSKRNEFDEAVTEVIYLFNETHVRMVHVRPVLQEWGISELQFERMKQERLSGPNRNQAHQLVHQIYQDAGRRQLNHACEELGRQLRGSTARISPAGRRTDGYVDNLEQKKKPRLRY